MLYPLNLNLLECWRLHSVWLGEMRHKIIHKNGSLYGFTQFCFSDEEAFQSEGDPSSCWQYKTRTHLLVFWYPNHSIITVQSRHQFTKHAIRSYITSHQLSRQHRGSVVSRVEIRVAARFVATFAPLFTARIWIWKHREIEEKNDSYKARCDAQLTAHEKFVLTAEMFVRNYWHGLRGVCEVVWILLPFFSSPISDKKLHSA